MNRLRVLEVDLLECFQPPVLVRASEEDESRPAKLFLKKCEEVLNEGVSLLRKP